jgi:hypothetical protein
MSYSPSFIIFVIMRLGIITSVNIKIVKVGCLHPITCTRSGSRFPSNATLF